MTHSAVTKLLRKEFNIKDDYALIQAYNNMPDSFYESIYFQKKDFIIDKMKNLVNRINSDASLVSDSDKDTRSGSMMSGLRYQYVELMETYKKHRKTLRACWEI